MCGTLHARTHSYDMYTTYILHSMSRGLLKYTRNRLILFFPVRNAESAEHVLTRVYETVCTIRARLVFNSLQRPCTSVRTYIKPLDNKTHPKRKQNPFV